MAAALFLSVTALIGGFFLPTLVIYLLGITSIILSILCLKIYRKLSITSIVISIVAIMIPIVLAILLAFSLDQF